MVTPWGLATWRFAPLLGELIRTRPSETRSGRGIALQNLVDLRWICGGFAVVLRLRAGDDASDAEPMPKLTRAKRKSIADIDARRRRVMDLVAAGRSVAEIAAIERMKPETIAKDYRIAVASLSEVLNKDGRIALAVEQVGRIRSHATACAGPNRDPKTRAIGIQADKLLADLINTPELLTSGADEARFSAYEQSWENPDDPDPETEADHGPDRDPHTDDDPNSDPT